MTVVFVPVAYNLTGFSLNRISLSAIVFSIGLLIDNAIVIIENIHRHWNSSDGETALVAAYAVQEVGPPTTLATLMVICALVPTAFITGIIGQYLRALPIGASLGMLFSLFVAFTITPYLCLRLFSSGSAQENQTLQESGSGKKLNLTSYYRRILAWFMDKPKRMFGAYAMATILLVVMVAMIPARIAIVRLLPYDDSNEISIMVDLPPATQLEDAYPLIVEAAQKLKAIPEVAACNVYVGTSAPVTFQGLARHYDFRKNPYQAEIQIQLLPNSKRQRKSHEIALDIRPLIEPVLSGKDTVVVVAERPPAVPTLSPLVAEVYGPDDEKRLALADRVRSLATSMSGVVDVDWTARPGTDRVRYEVDHQKAAIRGVVAAQAASTVRTLFAGNAGSWASLPRERDPVPIIVRLSRPERSTTADIRSLSFTPLTGGPPVPATEIGSIKRILGPYPMLRKDQQPVIMVTGVVNGDGPSYSGQDISKLLKKETVAGQRVQVIWNDEKPDIGKLCRILGRRVDAPEGYVQ